MSGHELALILGMTAITFLIRYAFFALGDRLAFPPLAHRALRFVPVAVLTAIIMPMVLLPDGAHWQISWHNPWLLGAGVTGVIAWRFHHLLASITGGMLVFFLFRWIAG
jgi:branched-subunit amino acid transport protein